MNILHINRNYLTSPLHQVMMNHLDATGVQSTVFAPTDDKNLSLIDPNPNVVVSECFTQGDRFFFGKKQKKIRAAVEREVDVAQFYLIHAYTLFTDGNCAMELSAKYHIPYVVAVRNTDVNDFFKKFPWLRKRGVEIMMNAAMVVFLSTGYRDQVFDRYVPRKLREKLARKTRIIPNGIDDFWLEAPREDLLGQHLQRLAQKKLRVIYAGRIDRNKNIPATVQALQSMIADGWDVEFTVVGKVADEKEFRKISQAPFVRYIPPQPRESLEPLYQSHDIFVMPSFTETFGLVYAEAMSRGIPVVYSQGQGFDGQFPEGTVGFHVDPHSVPRIRSAIEAVIENYAPIARECPRLAQSFCWGHIVARYELIYGELLTGEA